MASIALFAVVAVGSIQHCSFGRAEDRSTPGGSVPMFRHSTSATLAVFTRTFMRHVLGVVSEGEPDGDEVANGGELPSRAPCSELNTGSRGSSRKKQA